MNPYGDPNLNSGFLSPPPSSASGPSDGSHGPPPSSLPSPALIQTGQSSLMVLSCNPPQVSSDHDRVQSLVQSPSPDPSAPPLPALDPGLSLSSLALVSPQTQTPSPGSDPTPNPYLPPATPPSSQVFVIIPSPDLHPSPLPSQCSEDSSPDLECSICFSQFNNVFRCPKMLHCKHTFCLECLARMNVKSAEPSAIQCPLCRSFTPLPALGLPKLTTDSDVLSYLPPPCRGSTASASSATKGNWRSSNPHRRWGQRSLTSLRSMNRSLDVGLPSPPVGGHGEPGGMGDALFRLTGRPVCRAFLLTSVVMMMMLLTGIIIFLLTFNKDSE
ncbi:hypothetical protein INR49_018823 [Caranx melampygus]|nr:hypothetical protein INR49_018823 [Caranx melampygus]